METTSPAPRHRQADRKRGTFTWTLPGDNPGNPYGPRLKASFAVLNGGATHDALNVHNVLTALIQHDNAVREALADGRDLPKPPKGFTTVAPH
jgi:hypothetical protein